MNKLVQNKVWNKMIDFLKSIKQENGQNVAKIVSYKIDVGVTV